MGPARGTMSKRRAWSTRPQIYDLLVVAAGQLAVVSGSGVGVGRGLCLAGQGLLQQIVRKGFPAGLGWVSVGHDRGCGSDLGLVGAVSGVYVQSGSGGLPVSGEGSAW